MKTYGGVEVYLHALLIWQQPPAALPQGWSHCLKCMTHWDESGPSLIMWRVLSLIARAFERREKPYFIVSLILILGWRNIFIDTFLIVCICLTYFFPFLLFCVFICGLFGDCVSSSHYIPSESRPPNLLLCNFLQPVITTWRMREFVSWERH